LRLPRLQVLIYGKRGKNDASLLQK